MRNYQKASDVSKNAPDASYALNNAPYVSTLLKNSLVATHQDSVCTLAKIGKLCNRSDALEYAPDSSEAFNNTPDVLNSSTLGSEESTLILVATRVHNSTILVTTQQASVLTPLNIGKLSKASDAFKKRTRCVICIK